MSIEGSDVICRCNLGHYDFMSALAGKGNAVAHLQQKWGLSPDDVRPCPRALSRAASPAPPLA